MSPSSSTITRTIGTPGISKGRHIYIYIYFFPPCLNRVSVCHRLLKFYGIFSPSFKLHAEKVDGGYVFDREHCVYIFSLLPCISSTLLLPLPLPPRKIFLLQPLSPTIFPLLPQHLLLLYNSTYYPTPTPTPPPRAPYYSP